MINYTKSQYLEEEPPVEYTAEQRKTLAFYLNTYAFFSVFYENQFGKQRKTLDTIHTIGLESSLSYGTKKFISHAFQTLDIFTYEEEILTCVADFCNYQMPHISRLQFNRLIAISKTYESLGNKTQKMEKLLELCAELIGIFCSFFAKNTPLTQNKRAKDLPYYPEKVEALEKRAQDLQKLEEREGEFEQIGSIMERIMMRTHEQLKNNNTL